MIKIKPQIYNINAFDATLEKEIIFTWSGNQAFKNTCIIRNNATNVIVYQSMQETMKLSHTLPANTLTNGILYNMTIAITDSKGIVSEYSNPVLFYCYTNPTFLINNIVENQVIQNSSYPISLSYSQLEGEELQYYQVLLYNTNKNQIWTSGVKYDTSSLSTTLSNLEDNGVYYIRATGSTINGMSLDTGYIYFSVNYVQPNVYALITLENLNDEASVKIQSNIIALEMKYYGGTPIYKNDDYIDLTNTSNYTYLDAGFLFNYGTLNIKAYGLKDNYTILHLTNGEQTITLTKYKGTFEKEDNIRKVYFELLVPNTLTNYVVHSNFLDITGTEDTDIISIWIRKVGSLYEVYAENLSN